MKTSHLTENLKTYGIENWGAGYFEVSDEGNLVVCPDNHRTIEVMRIVEDLARRGITSPVVLRFPQILAAQVRKLNECFRNSITEFGYSKSYRGVYPIKVNQRKEVVEEILKAGQRYGFGIEVGSKPELMGALSLEQPPDSLLVLNGIKDETYIAYAYLAAAMGRNVVVVCESLHELFHLVRLRKKDQPMPHIGFRVRLNARGSGKWQESGGATAKFGLSAAELLEAITVLTRDGLVGQMKLLHFHIGSQITEIRRLKTAIKEAARVYAKVRRMGVEVEYLNVGGGLGVDYDGSKTSSDSSMNYSMQEYSNDVVYTIKDVCENENVPEPTIVTESGRAITAYHSLVISNVVRVIEVGREVNGMKVTDDDPQVVNELYHIYKNVSPKNYREFFHDANELRDQLFTLFNLGYLSLEDRARGETLYWNSCKRVLKYAKAARYFAEEFEQLEKLLAVKYVCNFSVFQSIPDFWAVGTLFPIMPIHRLNELPTVNANLADITCDSDGKVDQFVDLKDIKDFLELHPFHPEQPYYLAIMMTGAYQDIIGDYHNLFGMANEALVIVDENGKYHFQQVIGGDQTGEVLGYYRYPPKELLEGFEKNLMIRVRQGGMDAAAAKKMVDRYKQDLVRYPYLT
jgi:arginine decarboxylase